MPRTWRLCLIAICVLPVVGCVDRTFTTRQAELCKGGKYVVLPLADAPGPQADGSGEVITGDIVAELVRMPDVHVYRVSPKQLADALDASGFDKRDLYDPVVAAEVGRHLDAECVLFGELLHYAPEKYSQSSSFSIFRGGKTDSRYWVSLNVRIIRAADGKILYAGYGVNRSEEGYQDASRKACSEALVGLRKSLLARR